MISVVASIRMACLETPWVCGFGVKWNLKQSSTAPSSSLFSNVVKRIKDTHSETTKANNETRQYIQQATHNNDLPLNFPKATIFKHP